MLALNHQFVASLLILSKSWTNLDKDIPQISQVQRFLSTVDAHIS